MLPIEMPKRYVEVSMRFNPKQTPFLIRMFRSNNLVWKSTRSISSTERTEQSLGGKSQTGGRRIADSILDKIRLVPGTNSGDRTFGSRDTSPSTEGELSGSALVAGVGGLGSWAIHAYSELGLFRFRWEESSSRLIQI